LRAWDTSLKLTPASGEDLWRDAREGVRVAAMDRRTFQDGPLPAIGDEAD
jgi:hypothetical protein